MNLPVKKGKMKGVQLINVEYRCKAYLHSEDKIKTRGDLNGKNFISSRRL